MIRLARASKMLRSTGDEHYRLLASDEDRNSPECDTYERTSEEYSTYYELNRALKCSRIPDSESAGPTRTSSFSHPVLRQVLGSMLFVVVIDAAFIVYIAYIFSTVYFDDTNLPLVNPYIGLEDLYRQGRVKPPHLPPLLNQPHVAMQVSHTEPHKPASIGVHQVWQTDLGGISTIDRHLLVDNKVSVLTPPVRGSVLNPRKRLARLFNFVQWTSGWRNAHLSCISHTHETTLTATSHPQSATHRSYRSAASTPLVSSTMISSPGLLVLDAQTLL